MIAPKLLLIISLLSYITVNAQNIDNIIHDVENSRVIQPGQQTPDANLRHQNFCQTIGGTDSTNNSTVTATGDTQDVISCDMPANSPSTAGIIPVNSDGSLGRFVPNGSPSN